VCRFPFRGTRTRHSALGAGVGQPQQRGNQRREPVSGDCHLVGADGGAQRHGVETCSFSSTSARAMTATSALATPRGWGAAAVGGRLCGCPPAMWAVRLCWSHARPWRRPRARDTCVTAAPADRLEVCLAKPCSHRGEEGTPPATLKHLNPHASRGPPRPQTFMRQGCCAFGFPPWNRHWWPGRRSTTAVACVTGLSLPVVRGRRSAGIGVVHVATDGTLAMARSGSSLCR